jgi:hypothetical protein
MPVQKASSDLASMQRRDHGFKKEDRRQSPRKLRSNKFERGQAKGQCQLSALQHNISLVQAIIFKGTTGTAQYFVGASRK